MRSAWLARFALLMRSAWLARFALLRRRRRFRLFYSSFLPAPPHVQPWLQDDDAPDTPARSFRSSLPRPCGDSRAPTGHESLRAYRPPNFSPHNAARKVLHSEDEFYREEDLPSAERRRKKIAAPAPESRLPLTPSVHNLKNVTGSKPITPWSTANQPGPALKKNSATPTTPWHKSSTPSLHV